MSDIALFDNYEYVKEKLVAAEAALAEAAKTTAKWQLKAEDEASHVARLQTKVTQQAATISQLKRRIKMEPEISGKITSLNPHDVPRAVPRVEQSFYQKPSICRLVVFHTPMVMEDGSIRAGTDVPAVVMQVQGDLVALTVFGLGGPYQKNAKEGDGPGEWSWPARV